MLVTSERQQRINGPGGLALRLDADQIFPDNPGEGTPVIVELKGETATLNCALGEMEVMGHALTDQQMRWLAYLEFGVDVWLAFYDSRIAKDNLRERHAEGDPTAINEGEQ